MAVGFLERAAARLVEVGQRVRVGVNNIRPPQQHVYHLVPPAPSAPFAGRNVQRAMQALPLVGPPERQALLARMQQQPNVVAARQQGAMQPFLPPHMGPVEVGMCAHLFRMMQQQSPDLVRVASRVGGSSASTGIAAVLMMHQLGMRHVADLDAYCRDAGYAQPRNDTERKAQCVMVVRQLMLTAQINPRHVDPVKDHMRQIG